MNANTDSARGCETNDRNASRKATGRGRPRRARDGVAFGRVRHHQRVHHRHDHQDPAAPNPSNQLVFPAR